MVGVTLASCCSCYSVVCVLCVHRVCMCVVGGGPTALVVLLLGLLVLRWQRHGKQLCGLSLCVCVVADDMSHVCHVQQLNQQSTTRHVPTY